MDSIEQVKRSFESLLSEIERDFFYRDASLSSVPYPPSPFEIPWPHKSHINTRDGSSVESLKHNEAIIDEPENALKKIELLNYRLDEMKAAAVRDKSIIGHLKDDISALQKSEKKARNEREHVMHDHKTAASGITSEKDALQEELARLQKELNEKDRLLALRQTADKEISELKKELAQIKDIEEETKEHIAQKDGEVYELTRSTSEFLNKAMKDQEKQITEIAEKNAHLLYEKKKMRKELDTIKDDLESDKSTMQEKEKELNEIREKYMQMEEKLQAKEEEVSKVYLYVQNCERTIQEHEASLRSAQTNQAQDNGPVSSGQQTADGKSSSKVTRFIEWLKRPVIDIKENEDNDE